MIKIHMTGNQIRIRGHSGYAPPGQDIVCAGVSVLVQNLANSIEELTEDKILYDIKPGMADIYISGNLSEKTKTLVDSFFIGISSIAEEYPDFVIMQ